MERGSIVRSSRVVLRYRAMGRLAVLCAFAMVVSFVGAPAASAAVADDVVCNGCVDTADLAAFAVTADKLRPNAVTSGKIADGGVGTVDLADIAVTNAKLRPNAVTSGKIADGGVLNQDLGPNSVTTFKIANGEVMTADLAADAVTSDKILNGQVTTEDLAANAVTSPKIADGTIRNGDLAIRVIFGGGQTVGPNTGATDFAFCAANEVAIGGGARWDPPSQSATLALSGPSSNADGTIGGWRVDGSSGPGTTDRTLRATAFCLAS